MRDSSGFLVKSFLKHHVIFQEGTVGEHAYVLLEGKVEISGTVDGHKKVFAVIKPVSIFGEMALILDDQTRTATAVTIEDSKVVVINKPGLSKMIEDSPQIISSLLNVLVSRLKTATRQSMRAPNLPMSVCRILDLFAKNGVMHMPMDSTMGVLAECFVVHVDKVEAVLKQLASDGVLAIEPGDGGMRSIRILEKNFMTAVARKRRH